MNIYLTISKNGGVDNTNNIPNVKIIGNAMSILILFVDNSPTNVNVITADINIVIYLIIFI